MAGSSNPLERPLDQTSTWAVAFVCAVIVLISIILEKTLHSIGELFREKQKSALYEALEKIKGELMVLGFISLLLTFGQTYISDICVPLKYADTMLPCPRKSEDDGDHEETKHAADHRRLLWYEHRVLSSAGSSKSCEHGYVPLISGTALHQLHIFIFFLAVCHVIVSALVMLLGRLKIRGWKYWEREIADEYAMANDPTRFRLTHETSFVKGHSSIWNQTAVLFYIVCFFRQFFRSVSRTDYLTMRHGFISVHLAPGSKFDFQKYIKRSLEDDFKVVVGINSFLWAAAVIYLLLNVDGWQAMIFLSIMPLAVILAVGTKLQAIITQMAIEIQERHAVVQGIPLVQVSDKHFWFGRPKLVLHLIHLTLFQNAFEITYFIWTSYEFGLYSCFHDNFNLAIIRVVIGLGAQCLCSYITLPLYALVTQMGSTMKKSIFDEQTSKALKNWQKSAMKKKNDGKGGGAGGGAAATRTLGGSPPDSPDNSPMRRNPHENNNYMNNPGDSRLEMTNAGGPPVNIVASVDIPGDHHPHSDGAGFNRDLLSDP